MFEYRVTKYNPALRDSTGAYTRDEWISFGDVGSTFGGVVLTKEEYGRVESAYAAAALAYLREAGLRSLVVKGLENPANHQLPFGEGSVLSLEQVGETVRKVLRNEFWCRLEDTNGFVHLGYDYYMYVEIARQCPEAEQVTRSLGLFVEEFPSPYKLE